MSLKLDVPVERVVAELENRIPEAMDRERVPGLSIALIRDAKCVWAKGFGVRDLETGELVTEDTLFAGCLIYREKFPILFFVIPARVLSRFHLILCSLFFWT